MIFVVVAKHLKNHSEKNFSEPISSFAKSIGISEIIKLPNGRLTTMYHYMKNSNTKIEEVLSNSQFENADL